MDNRTSDGTPPLLVTQQTVRHVGFSTGSLAVKSSSRARELLAESQLTGRTGAFTSSRTTSVDRGRVGEQPYCNVDIQGQVAVFIALAAHAWASPPPREPADLAT